MSLSGDGANDSMSIANDSDIYSLKNSIGAWINRTESVAPSNAMDTGESEDTLDVAEYQRGKIESWIAHLDSIGDSLNGSPPPPANNSKTSSASTAGARPGKRRVSSGRRPGEAQNTESRNKSQSTSTHRGKGSGSKKPQRRPTVIDLTENDGSEVQTDISHLCKKLCIWPEETNRTGSPSRPIHCDESDVASNGIAPQVPDLIQPETQTLLPAVSQALKRLELRQFYQDNKVAQARCWGGNRDRRFVILGNGQANVCTPDDENAHSERSERPVCDTEAKDQDTEYGPNLGIQPDHELETHMQHERDENDSMIMADAPADANLVEDAEELFGVKGLIRNVITNYSTPDYIFQRVRENNPMEPDWATKVPILREFNDKNGRWTYSRDDVHFVRAT
ncbi:MAG: hypothetical protein Q9175_006565 [Cornicularia normoerica]